MKRQRMREVLRMKARVLEHRLGVELVRRNERRTLLKSLKAALGQ